MDGSGSALHRCADTLVDALEAAGVDTIVGVPGGAISPLYDALIGRGSIRVINARHETTAVFMAIGQARMRPGVLPCVLATSGPGITNALTGVAAAMGEGTPVMLIAGEVPRAKFGRGALQEGSAGALDAVAMLRSITLSSEEIAVPTQAAHQVALAAQRALRDRGPVFLTLPLDVAVAEVPPGRRTVASYAEPIIDERALAAAVQELRRAQNPLVLVGAGARGASAAIRTLAARLGAPVITTPKGKGIIPETDPRCLGVFGYGGHQSSGLWLQRTPPDVILALGCGFSEPSTNSWSPLLKPTRALIHVDVDGSRFGRNYHADIPVVADCAQFVSALLARLPDAPERTRSDFGGVRYFDPAACLRESSPLRPERVLTVLQEELGDDTVYTADIGEHLLFAVHYLRCDRPDQLIASISFGTMGSGIGAAVGAQLAAPTRPVVSICGDFGFQMYGMELATCVQERLPVTFVVFNDARMRMVEAGLQRNYGRALAMDGPRVNFAALAGAHGARGFTVETSDDLRAALRARPTDGPCVLDVRMDPDASFALNGRVQEISNFAAK
jgi:acetolactate synthase-1/2/3 large subunit